MSDEETLVHVLTIVDGESEELVYLVEITGFILNEFHLQFDVDPQRDPQMLDRYSVGPDDVDFLMKQLKHSIEFQFEKYAYFIEAARKK